MTRMLRLSIGLGAVLVAAMGCGGKTAINTDAGEGEGDAIAVMTGMGGHGGAGGSVATTGSGGVTGTGGIPGAGGASGSVGTTGAGGSGGAAGAGGTIGTTGAGGAGVGGTTGTTGAGGQAGVDAGIMMCVAGAVCPTVNARCTAPCGGGGGLVRTCFCDPNGRVACQNCMPPPPPACAANVISGRACNVAMNPQCGGCLNGQTETCTCMPAGGGMRGVWTCVIPVPVQACQ